MILIATADDVLATLWRQVLSSEHVIYELAIQDIRSLDICLKKVQFDVLLLDKTILGGNGVHEISSIHYVS